MLSFLRVLARVRDEQGMGLVEVTVASAILLVVMVSLIQVLTVGLLDVGLARQRQSATGLAGQTLEQVRGVAYTRLERGLDTSELSSATHVEQCEDGVFRLDSCPGGEEVVHSNISDADEPAGTTPLKPHYVQTGVGPTAFERWIYVTRAPSGAYRLTAIVSWAGQLRAGAASLVRTETLVFSPEGCGTTVVHPYAAPCEPFLFGRSTVREGEVEITGTIGGVPVEASLRTPSAKTSAQIEQIWRVEGQTQGAQLMLDGDQYGPPEIASVADTDNSPSTAPQYSSDTYTDGAESAGAALTLSLGSPNTGATSSAVRAKPSDAPCSGETDLLPCAHSVASAVGDLRAELAQTTVLASITPSSGTESPASATTDREAGSGGDGFVRSRANRSLGSVGLIQLPIGPDGSPAYLVELTELKESAGADAGVGGQAPLATSEGMLRYWDGAGFQHRPLGFSPILVTIPTTTRTFQDGTEVTVSGFFQAGGSSQPPPSCPSACASDIPIEAAEARTSPALSGTFDYKVEVGGVQVAKLMIHVDLGGLEATARYQPAPIEPVETVAP